MIEIPLTLSEYLALPSVPAEPKPSVSLSKCTCDDYTFAVCPYCHVVAVIENERELAERYETDFQSTRTFLINYRKPAVDRAPCVLQIQPAPRSYTLHML